MLDSECYDISSWFCQLFLELVLSPMTEFWKYFSIQEMIAGGQRGAFMMLILNKFYSALGINVNR